MLKDARHYRNKRVTAFERTGPKTDYSSKDSYYEKDGYFNDTRKLMDGGWTLRIYITH